MILLYELVRLSASSYFQQPNLAKSATQECCCGDLTNEFIDVVDFFFAFDENLIR